MNRRSAIAVMAGMAMAGCRKGPRRIIRVSALPQFMLAPLYLADELGWFHDAGLEIDVQPLAETTQIIPLLAAGQVDVTFNAATPALFNAIAKGARTRVVSAREVAIPGCTQEVYGSRRSFPGGFDDPAALRGKRVAVTAPTSLTAFLLDALLESAGMTTSDIQLLIMRFSESAPALLAGQLDVVVDLGTAFSSPDIVAGPSVARLLPGFQYSYAQFGRTLLDGDIPTGAAFLRAYFRGVSAFRAGAVPRMIDRLAMDSGMDPAAVRAVCRRRLSDDGRIDPASVQRMIDWSIRKGFFEGRMSASQVIDTRFVEAAMRS